ncbi:MAG: carboxypeptidase regulatory-like domain-containing protein [Bacteroidota bacterium]
MKQLKRVIIPILLLVVVSALPLWSGTTGKIAGTVINKANGEPVPGANIVVAGTSLGASTDLNGHYTILYVPPGTYNVQVSFIGFRKITMNDVRVYIDQTARIDFSLEVQEIELSVSVVLGEQLTIRPDVATSVAAVSDKEIASMPINNVVSAVGLQAGVRGGWSGNLNGAQQGGWVDKTSNNLNLRGKVSVQGGLNIRGGEGDEILFMVDGVTMRDPRNNEPSTRVALSAVKDIAVERGGFNAEYGQVRSGVINVTTREGAKRGYSGSFQLRLSPPAPKYVRAAGVLDIQDPNSFVLRPFFDPDVCWTGTANGKWDQYTSRQYVAFKGWNEVSKELCTDNDPNNDLTPAGAQRAFEYETRKVQPNNQADYDIDAGFGGPVPFIGQYLGDLRFFTSYRSTRDVLVWPLTRPDYKDFNWMMQMTSDITPTMKLRLSGMVGRQFTIRHNWDGTGQYFYPHYPNEIAGVTANNFSSLADLFFFYSDFNFTPSQVGEQSLAAKLTHAINPSTFYEVSLEHFRRDYDTEPFALRDTSVHYEIIPGFFEDSNPFGYWPGTTNGVIINGNMHASKARDWTVVSSTTLKADFTSQVNFQNLVKGGIEFDYNDLNFDYGTINSGTEGKLYSSRVQMRVFPIRAAAYAQDKLEAKGFTVNLGLRLDYSDPKSSWWSLDPYNVNFFSPATTEAMTFTMEKPKPQWQLSPRLGIAHPVSEDSKLFFNYGHFREVPQYESLFRVQRNDSRQVTSLGNPNLILAKTISYELGYDHILFNDYLLQIAAFYNDISDVQNFTEYQSIVKNVDYVESSSNYYQDTRGFELTLRKTTGRWWSGFANYTYQVNTTGHFGEGLVTDDPSAQKRYNEATVNLYQDRPIPQPYARLNLSLYTPEDWGPDIFGHKILGGWRVNATVDWQAGYWTTYNPKNIASLAYNVQSLDYYNTALRVDKIVQIGKFKLQLFMDINNVLNTLRLWNTGQAYYLASLHLPASDQYDNIPGSDKVGAYRKPGVEWQPEVYQNTIDRSKGGETRPIYFERSTGLYWQYVYNPAITDISQRWSQVDQARIDQINNDKAYIEMPRSSTFWFLDPRQIFFGVRLSFDFTD